MNEIDPTNDMQILIDRSKEVKVYNCSTGDHNPLNWGQFRTYGFETWMKHPGCDMLWYPSISFISGEYSYRIAAFLFHYLPAYTIDFLSRLIGRQPKLVLIYSLLRTLSITSKNQVHHKFLLT